MTVTQTVEVPDTHRLVLDVPHEVPTGSAIIAYFPINTINAIPRMRDLKPNPDKIPVRGCHKGEFWMADDFDEPLDDFKDYM